MQKVEGSSPFIRFVSPPIPPRSALAAAVIAMAITPVILGGCGSSGDATSAPTTRAASTGCVATTYRCVRVELTSEFPEALTVDVGGAEQGDQLLTLAPGETVKVTGYTSRGGATDLIGDIWIASKADSWDAAPGDARMVMKSRNPIIGTPCLGFHLLGPAKVTWCQKIAQPSVGARSEVYRYDAGWSVARWERLRNTTNFVEFKATIRPT